MQFRFYKSVTTLCLLTIITLASCKKMFEVTGYTPPVGTIVQNDSVTLNEATFTELGLVSQGTASPKIMNKLVGLIDSTPAQAHIYMSIYLIDYTSVINALVNADQRGVKLHLLIDMSRDESIQNNQNIIQSLQNLLSSNAELYEVHNDASTIAINHNKFVLFSQVNINNGRAFNVVFQTSHNFTLSDSRKIQDAVTITHKGLYDAYTNYWTEMKNRAANGMSYYTYKEYNNAATGVSAYFLPRRSGGNVLNGDNIMDILNNITDAPTAHIMVGMSEWTDTRTNIANKLQSLKNSGADVQVISKSSIDASILALLNTLQQSGGYVKILNMTDNTKPFINIHSKFMLIKGMWKGEPCELVVTGSHNLTANALENNNETILVFINNSTLFNAYLAYFTNIKTL